MPHCSRLRGASWEVCCTYGWQASPRVAELPAGPPTNGRAHLAKGWETSPSWVHLEPSWPPLTRWYFLQKINSSPSPSFKMIFCCDISGMPKKKKKKATENIFINTGVPSPGFKTGNSANTVKVSSPCYFPPFSQCSPLF